MKDPASKTVFKELNSYPAISLTYPLPQNIKPGEEPFYEMVCSGEARTCGIKRFDDVFANRELVLWKDGAMIEEAFVWPWIMEKVYGSFTQKAKFRVKNLLRRTIKIDEPILWCLDGYSTGGYFHWIVDILPRLWMAKHYLPDIRFAIPDYFLSRWPFCKDFFSLLGVERLLVIKNKEKYLLQDLIMPTRAGNPFFLQPRPLKAGVRWLKTTALSQSQVSAGARIYISRKKARYRKIVNEEQLLPVLNKFGFNFICLEDYSLVDQISICSKAEVIMGLHGAGLVNLAFMEPGSKVIEIRPNKVYHMYTCFFTLAPYFECNYNYVLCDYAPEKLPTEKRIDDHSVIVDPELLAREIGALLTT